MKNLIKTSRIGENARKAALEKIKSEKDGSFAEIISKNKNEILKCFENDIYKKIDFEKLDLNNNKYSYPSNFEIISEYAYLNLLKALGKENNEEELSILLINGKVYIKFIKDQNNNLNKFIFGYILNKENNEELNYEIQNILKYYKEDERNMDFERIANGKKFDSSNNESMIYDDNNYVIGKALLINNNNIPITNEKMKFH